MWRGRLNGGPLPPEYPGGDAEERLQDHSLTNTIKGTVGLKGPGRHHAGLRPPPEPNIGLKRGYMLGDRRKGKPIKS